MYKEIFNEIVSVMHEDYAGCEDKKGWDQPEFYRQKLEINEMNPNEFVELINDYLIDFKDHHVYFKGNHMQNPQLDRGFAVRRYEDRLYVISVHNDQTVSVGDVIVELEGVPIKNLRVRHHRYLDENHPERENWNPILMKHETCTIQRADGTTNVYAMMNYVKSPFKGTYRIEVLDKGPVLITLTDFADPDAISTLIRENKKLLDSAESLIIDVRVNNGGMDSSFIELIPYIFPGGETKIEEMPELLFNCTARTSDLVVQMIEEEIHLINDENVRNIMRQFSDFYQRNRGKGFVSFDMEQQDFQRIKGLAKPKHIVILTDVYCGSSGDTFVEMCKLSTKTTVVGRATAGLNDYSNLAIRKWQDEFELWYPTSKLKRVDEGKGMSGIGIEPDVYIPWTPEHLQRDVDLEKAFELIGSSKSSIV